MRAIAKTYASGRLSPEEIDEERIASHLYTAGIPDPDLLIRPGRRTPAFQFFALPGSVY